MVSRLFCAVILFTCVLALSASATQGRYTSRHLYDKSANVKIYFPLKHSDDVNAQLKQKLLEVSDPSSPSYGKHMTSQQIRDLVAAPEHVIETVKNHIEAAGGEQIQINEHRDFVTAIFNVAEAEEFFNVDIHEYEHVRSGKKVARAMTPVEVPSALREHVAFIGGLSHFPEFPHGVSADAVMKPFVGATTGPTIVAGAQGDGQVIIVVQPVCADGNVSTTAVPCQNNPPAISSFTTYVSVPNTRTTSFTLNLNEVECFVGPKGNTMCRWSVDQLTNFVPNTIGVSQTFADASTTPIGYAASPAWPSTLTTSQSLSALYGYSDAVGTNPRSSQSVTEFLDQYYSTKDLFDFFDYMGLDRIDAANVLGPNDQTNPGGEADLDIQYIMAVAKNVKTWFWSFGGGSEFQEPFMDWLLAIDNTPDNIVPLVHSTSYGDMESNYTQIEVDRINAQFIKCGLRGLSLLFSSGDDGVGNFGSREDPATFCNPLTPTYPAGSPYVTAVGGTQMSTVVSPGCQQTCNGRPSCMGLRYGCSATAGEIACSSDTGGVITTGGGFSNLNAMPSYQASVVATFMQRAQERGQLPPDTIYNTKGRAFPDVAVMAHNFMTVVNGSFAPIHGTSASAPLLTGMIALMNDQLLNLGRAPLGFLNPLFYKMYAEDPSIFNDVVMGNNKCSAGSFPGAISCCEHGFEALPGYDPVTGLGSIKYQKMLNYVLAATAPAPTPAKPESAITKSTFWSAVGPLIGFEIVALAIAIYAAVSISRNRYMAIN